MTMDIKYNKFTNVKFVESPNQSGPIRPKLIVMHYTAGYTAQSAIDTFENRASKVSAHLVIDTNGTVTQMVAFNRKAWHAGPSRFGGYRNLNDHSIGIELVNIGYLKAASGFLIDAYGRKVNPEIFSDGLIVESHPRVGSGEYAWPNYTDAQLNALDAVVLAILSNYPIESIVSHEEIDTRGWKTDPGPAFPMNRYRAMLNNNRTDEPTDQRYEVTAASLNVRGGPSTSYSVIANLLRGEIVTVQAKEDGWLFVTHGEAKDEGWISARYAVPE